MQNIPDNKNWRGNVDQLMRTYKIDLNEDQIQELSSRSFKNIVKRAIKDFAFKQLKNECSLQSKTKEICYRDYKIQPSLKEINPNDEIIEDKGVKVFVDSAAIMYLLGTEMDYKKEELSSSFVFNNPNETERCGCGESFKTS